MLDEMVTGGIMNNLTFRVRTLYNCDTIEDYKQIYGLDSLWVETVFGCRLLIVLREMFRFNMAYIIPNTHALTEDERVLSIRPEINDTIDIYAKPMGFSSILLETSCATEAIFTWRYYEYWSKKILLLYLFGSGVSTIEYTAILHFGFILKRPYTVVLRKFYSLPFTRPVWNCLYLMIFVVSGIFFYLSRWEKKFLGGYSCYHYELLLVIGACCQHILPLQANTSSRRMAYLSFILCAYLLYSFYTSNLLSHLVSDKDSSMNLDSLACSDYEFVQSDIYNAPSGYDIYRLQVKNDFSMNIIQSKLSRAKHMNTVDGLKAVMKTKTALLSDYSVVYPVLTKMFEFDEVCQLIRIDLYSNIKKYFYTSKNFTYKEQFKVGILRVKETGVLQRILLDDALPPLNCAPTYPMSAELDQITMPLAVLLGCYVAAPIIMLIERWYHRRYRLWPYLD